MEFALLQIIASSVFAFAGAIIAATAVFVSYRNNFGWRPVILYLKYNWGGTLEYPGFVPIELKFEFWNRQKYPIALREIKLFLSEVELVPKGAGVPPTSKDWHALQRGVLLYAASPESLEGTKHLAFNVKAAIKATGADYDHRVRIIVNYFDPIKNKNRVASYEYDFDSDGVPQEHNFTYNVNS